MAARSLHRSTIALVALLACAGAADAAPATTRDGQHDFDWMFGQWTTTLRKLEKPLSGSTKWIEFEGTQVSHALHGGLANVDEFSVDSGETHVRGVTLRLYNPETHEWSLYWANATKGVLAMPATVGHWRDDAHGEFFDREDFNGKPIIVRYQWTVSGKDAAHFEQAFSPDDGKTWEVNWVSDLRRTAP